MTDNEEMLEFEGEMRHQTDLAWLFWVEDSEEEIWFPKSQCSLNTAETTISVPRWLARLKDLA